MVGAVSERSMTSMLPVGPWTILSTHPFYHAPS